MTVHPPALLGAPGVLRQNTSTAEGRAVGLACTLLDLPVQTVSLGALRNHRVELAAGALPVGSVEFVREAMGVLGVAEPAPLSYVAEIQPLLGRQVRMLALDQVRGTQFVKPVQTKQFTGFVWTESAPDSQYNEHDLEQLQVLRALPQDTMLWVADPVVFQCEWRYYVLDGRVLGAARYDPDGAEDAPSPAGDVLEAALIAMGRAPGAPVAYALDLGVLADGRTVAVEINDAWAIGLYGGALGPRDYLQLLAARWRQFYAPRAA